MKLSNNLDMNLYDHSTTYYRQTTLQHTTGIISYRLRFLSAIDPRLSIIKSLMYSARMII